MRLRQFRRGVGTQFLGEQLPPLLEQRQCLRLPPRPVQGPHQQGPCPLSKRVRRNHFGQGGQRCPVIAQRHRRLRAILQSREPRLGEANSLHRGEGRIRHIGKGRAAPQPRGLVQQDGSGGEILVVHGLSTVLSELDEPMRIDVPRCYRQSIPGSRGLDDLLGAARSAQCTPQPRHLRLQGMPGIGRWLLPVETIDQPISRHDAAGVDRQQCHQRPHLRAADRDRTPVGQADFDGTEDSELHGSQYARAFS